MKNAAPCAAPGFVLKQSGEMFRARAIAANDVRVLVENFSQP